MQATGKIVLLLTLIFSVSFFSCSSSDSGGGNTSLSALQFAEKLKASAGAVVLDVRTPGEFSSGHLENAVNIDWNDESFDRKVADLPKDVPIFVYCLSGGRSSSAAASMRKSGFKQVYEMDGGMMQWRAANLPETTASSVKKDPGMTEEQFLAMIPSDQAVLVDFYAEWCEPCKRMKPWLDEITQQHSDRVKVIRIDADKNPALCKAMKVDALPVLQYYSGGKQSWTQTGFMSKEEAWKKLGL